jgi:hypothetical protein
MVDLAMSERIKSPMLATSDWIWPLLCKGGWWLPAVLARVDLGTRHCGPLDSVGFLEFMKLFLHACISARICYFD